MLFLIQKEAVWRDLKEMQMHNEFINRLIGQIQGEKQLELSFHLMQGQHKDICAQRQKEGNRKICNNFAADLTSTHAVEVRSASEKCPFPVIIIYMCILFQMTKQFYIYYSIELLEYFFVGTCFGYLTMRKWSLRDLPQLHIC